MGRLSWRRQPNETGLSRVNQSERDHELRFNGETIGHVSLYCDGNYYFYGCGKNSLSTNDIYFDVESAKVACKEWVVNSELFKGLSK